MKRCEQLKKLSREHHGSLSMALKISKIAKKNVESELLEGINTVQHYYNDELELHFQHEEQTIFSTIFKQYKEHIGVATTLLKEHGYLRVLIQRLTLETAQKDLADFAQLLKEHTRVEERELFPIIQDLFTDEQLDRVLNFEPLD